MLNYPKLPYNTLNEKADVLSLPNKLCCPLNQVGRVHWNDATCLSSCHLDSERKELSVNGENAVLASERAALPFFVPHLRKRHPLLINSHRRSSAATLLPAARHPVASQFPLLHLHAVNIASSLKDRSHSHAPYALWQVSALSPAP